MTEPAPTLRFDRFTFHPASGELRNAAGETVRLEPQPAKVLSLLAGRAGELVTREELQREVWPDGTFVDFERGLNYCVAKIRAALGDSAAEPKFVETLPRRGYRFLAAVEVGEGRDEEGQGAPRAGPARIPPAAVFAMVMAVARFDNETGRGPLDREAQTLTDSIVEALTRPPGRWGVIGNAAILRTPRSFRDLSAIEEALDADLIVLG